MKHNMPKTSTEKLMQPEELKALTKESYEEGYKELVRLLNLEFKKAATSGKFMITITIPPLFKKDIIPQLEEMGYKVGEMVSYDANEDEIVNVDLIDIDAKGMIFKMPCAIKDIKKGDIIMHNGVPVFVTSIEDGIQVTDVAAGEKKTILPTKSMFGFDFVTKVVSMIDFTGNTASENNPFGNLMPLMLMCGDGGLKENLIPMMFLMNQTNGENQGAFAFDMSNPLLLMALMQDKGGSESNDFFTMMILGQMMKSK